MSSVVIDVLNSDLTRLQSPEAQKPSIGLHLYLCVYFFFTACTECVCVHALSFREDKHMPTRTSNKNSVSSHRSPEIFFSHPYDQS